MVRIVTRYGLRDLQACCFTSGVDGIVIVWDSSHIPILAFRFADPDIIGIVNASAPEFEERL